MDDLPAAAPTTAAPCARSAYGSPAPRVTLGPLGIGLRVVVAVVILLGANLVAGLVPALLTLVPGAAESLSDDSPWTLAVGLGLQALVLGTIVLALWAWMRWVERAPLRAAGWRWTRSSIGWLLLGVGAAASTAIGVTALLPATGPVLDDEAIFGQEASDPVLAVGLAAYYLGLAFVQQGIPEELLFRGWLMWRLRHRPVVAIVVTTLAFTVIHLVSNGGQQSVAEHIAYLALPFGFALLAAGLLLWTGSLWAAIGVHGGFHVGNYAAVLTLSQVDPVTSWLAIGGVQAALGVALIVTALRRGRRIHPTP